MCNRVAYNFNDGKQRHAADTIYYGFGIAICVRKLSCSTGELKQMRENQNELAAKNFHSEILVTIADYIVQKLCSDSPCLIPQHQIQFAPCILYCYATKWRDIALRVPTSQETTIAGKCDCVVVINKPTFTTNEENEIIDFYNI